MKLLFFTGSRGEWGYIRPILRLCQQRGVDFALCVTNMHLLPAFGYSAGEIEKDGFKIDYRIHMALDGYTHATQAKSLGICLMSLVDVLTSCQPDWLVLAGDRGEQMMGAVAGAFCYVPIAHIQAGELSGNIDGMTRHAIGKFAHLHFAANEDAAKRLVKLGEERFRIHQVGAPQLDELVSAQYSDRATLEEKYLLDLSQPFIMMVQHPVTEEFEQAAEQVVMTIAALNERPEPKIVILPNNDAGSSLIRDGIERDRAGEYHLFANLPRADYLGFLALAAAIVGNSSSGLLEAPSFKVPALNLGRRQEARVRGLNVVDAPFTPEGLQAGLAKVLDPAFRAELQRSCVNPYGDGQSAGRILEILSQTPINSSLMNKQLTY
jgi:GDP/UDP-N,N'-diacetylbacillosamine 2-epimerase (hydrolysing)